MNKLAPCMIAAVAVLTLAGCGKSQDASEDAAADTVEMPAEEAMGGATGMPSAMATDAASAMPDDIATDPSMAASSTAAM